MKVPVLFLIFCRKDAALQALESIRNYRPDRLYIAADGARANKDGEKEQCEQTRQSILNAIDWDCEVNTLFRKQNLGCANAVYGAVTWFFENEEYGVIIEDDVVIHPDFYCLCERLLPHYQNEEKIMLITANNATPNLRHPDKLVFTNRAWIWGWASWRRAWTRMDMSMSRWKQYNPLHLIERFGLFQGLFFWYYWSLAYKNITTLKSWATRWDFALTAYNGVCLSSNANLSKNIGISNAGGTHYDEDSIDMYSHLPFGSVRYPIQLPEKIEIDKDKAQAEQKEFKRIRLIGLKKKIRHSLK